MSYAAALQVEQAEKAATAGEPSKSRELEQIPEHGLGVLNSLNIPYHVCLF